MQARSGAESPHPNEFPQSVKVQLRADLVRWARDLLPGPGHIHLLSQRSDRLVLRVDDVVVKAHAQGTNFEDLTRRLQIVSEGALKKIFLTPLKTEVLPVTGGRWATLWPFGYPVESDLEEAPWDEAGRLLARLHRVQFARDGSANLPGCRAWEKVQAALVKLSKLNQSDARVQLVRAAAATLKDSDRCLHEGPVTLVHGDWHFGQLVSLSPCRKKHWRLIDVDDMGWGNPAWDLARPAAFFAAGLLAPHHWERFLESYRAEGGPAVAPSGQPWDTLDRPARALIVQCAAAALVRSVNEDKTLLEAELPLFDACQRMARLHS